MLTPEEAHRRIRQGAKNRHDPRTYARSIVRKWPALDENARAELRDILSPIVGRTALTASEGGGRSDA